MSWSPWRACSVVIGILWAVENTYLLIKAAQVLSSGKPLILEEIGNRTFGLPDQLLILAVVIFVVNIIAAALLVYGGFKDNMCCALVSTVVLLITTTIYTLYGIVIPSSAPRINLIYFLLGVKVWFNWGEVYVLSYTLKKAIKAIQKPAVTIPVSPTGVVTK